MKKAAVLGYPVGHSLSPLLHGFWLNQYEIAGRYEAIEVEPEALGETLQRLKGEGYAGVNITVPHKEEAFRLVDRRSAAAERIGAVNTVIFRPDGVLYGDNTDVYGFMESIGLIHGPARVASTSAVVLGAGGAARAVVAGLLEAGAPHILLSNRTRARAEALASSLGDGRVEVAKWETRTEALADAGLLVNTTVLGMEGQEPLDCPLEKLPPDAVVVDIVYRPLETPLLRQARRRGHPVVGGLAMLMHQAVPAFEAFFRRRPEVTPALEQSLIKAFQ